MGSTIVAKEEDGRRVSDKQTTQLRCSNKQILIRDFKENKMLSKKEFDLPATAAMFKTVGEE